MCIEYPRIAAAPGTPGPPPQHWRGMGNERPPSPEREAGTETTEGAKIRPCALDLPPSSGCGESAALAKNSGLPGRTTGLAATFASTLAPHCIHTSHASGPPIHASE